MHRRTLLAAAVAAFPVRVLALYDPKPSPLLSFAPGAWSGALTYRDWSNPDKLVTLPARLQVALSVPEELTLFYTFAGRTDKFSLILRRTNFLLTKTENSATGEQTFRNRFEFRRGEA